MSNLQQTTLCKLCNEREVGSQESHIIPYFLTKSLYFKNGKNQGMKTIKFVKRVMGEVEDKWLQDGLKQKYIFCGECEKYFELLDTHFCNKIYYSLKKDQLNNNQSVSLNLERKIATCGDANQNIIALFVVSLFLRCHISDLHFCKTFQLNNDEFGFIQQLLNQFFSLKHTELNAKLPDQSLSNQFSYLIFTYYTKNKNDDSMGFVEAQFRSNIGMYYLVVNDYIFTLYLKEPHSIYSEGLNANTEKVKITVFPHDQFEKLQRINLEKYIKDNKLSWHNHQ
jgi:hypothetical protein